MKATLARYPWVFAAFLVSGCAQTRLLIDIAGSDPVRLTDKQEIRVAIKGDEGTRHVIPTARIAESDTTSLRIPLSSVLEMTVEVDGRRRVSLRERLSRGPRWFLEGATAGFAIAVSPESNRSGSPSSSDLEGAAALGLVVGTVYTKGRLVWPGREPERERFSRNEGARWLVPGAR